MGGGGVNTLDFTLNQNTSTWSCTGYRVGLGPLLGGRVLLLTTVGRKSGLLRTTPLQYERIGNEYLVGSMRGVHADWYQNLLVDPCVVLQIGRERIQGVAEPVDDPERVYEFLRYRLERHPRMIGAILRLDGLSNEPDNEELSNYARGLTFVVVRPETERGLDRGMPVRHQLGGDHA
jgi:deazaflavin-dependent oxidoreductase (nitroreductase family)